jgi:hypothetical protein
MLALDILYVALATIAVMVVLQIVTFVGARMMYPPEPKIIYRDVPVMMQAPPPAPPLAPPPPQEPPPLFPQNGPTLTQPQQEVQLPEYEPRKSTSTSLRVDPELPAGLQETRPDGT